MVGHGPGLDWTELNCCAITTRRDAASHLISFFFFFATKTDWRYGEQRSFARVCLRGHYTSLFPPSPFFARRGMDKCTGNNMT